MAKVRCSVCRKEDESSKMAFCSCCELWVHYECAGRKYGGIFQPNIEAKCPKCKKILKK